jgi:hypothetical protein
MGTQEKLEYVEKYLKKCFEEWLVNDIQMIKDKKLYFTFPYVLLVSAGIDFLGLLAKGFNSGSKIRSCYFIEEWMGKLNPLYKNKKISVIIYKSARCGSSHQAIYKKEVESSSIAYSADKNLYHIKCLDGRDRIFIHAWQFVDDFIKSQQLFRDEYVKQNPEDVFNNLQEMLKEETIEGFEEFIEELKKDGKSFDAEKELKNNPKVKSVDKKNSRIELYNDDSVAPSAAPYPEVNTYSCTTTSQPKDHAITVLPNEDEN